MRTERDAERSIKRWVALALGDDWEVRLWTEVGTFALPYAKVTQAGEVTTTGGAVFVTQQAAFSVVAWTLPAETVEQAQEQARDVEEALWHAFRGGSTPLRVPLLDYDGKGLDQPGEWPADHPVMRIEDFRMERRNDPDDDRRLTVECSFRANWRRASDRLAMYREGRTVQSLRVGLVSELSEQTVDPVGIGSVAVIGRARATEEG